MSYRFTNVKVVDKSRLKTALIGLVFLIFIESILLLYFIRHTSSQIYSIENINLDQYEVGIVFGAGVNNNGEPSKQLEDRLITASELYLKGYIDLLILSGNNSSENNYETDVMRKYLTQVEGIPDHAIITDPWGYRTYDTCARGTEVYGLDKAILITQKYHLYRSLILCEHLGVSSVGVSATKSGYSDWIYYLFREFLAINKATIDIYLFEPTYHKGL